MDGALQELGRDVVLDLEGNGEEHLVEPGEGRIAELGSEADAPLLREKMGRREMVEQSVEARRRIERQQQARESGEKSGQDPQEPAAGSERPYRGTERPPRPAAREDQAAQEQQQGHPI